MGHKPVRQQLQIDSMDDALRISLWNALELTYFREIVPYERIVKNNWLHEMVSTLWVNFFKWPLTTVPSRWEDVQKQIGSWFFNDAEWHDVYDLVEFFVRDVDFDGKQDQLRDVCNVLMEREGSAYRFVGNEIGRITSEQEIAAIEEAHGLDGKYNAVGAHIDRSLSLLSDRKNPDYRNSIKEAISAVEAACRIVTGDKKATLGEALNKIEKNGEELHTALKGAFSKLYGYTSDEKGIRHALLELPKIDFDHAKFMLVTCAAFVNFLASKGNPS